MSAMPTTGIEPRRVSFPVPPVCTQFWEPEDWERWIAKYGVLEPLTLRCRHAGTWHAVGRNEHGDLVYRITTEGEV